MDRHRDLPLFRWRPTSKVLAFPLARRTAKVRRVAEVLAGKRGRASDAYWRQTVETLADQLQRAGIAEAEVRKQLDAFHDAVRVELSRQTYRRGPDGAA